MAWTPFAALLLADAGVEDVAIPLILALFPLAYLVASPVWGVVADGLGSSRGLLRLAALGTALGAVGFALAPGPGAMAALLFATALCRAPQFPMVDTLTVRALPEGRAGYGRVRLWGSATWLILALAGGFLREQEPRAILWVGVAFLVATLAWVFALPEAPTAVSPARPRPWELAKHPLFGPLLLGAALHGVAVATFDNLFALHVERSGFDARYAGIGIAVGVAAEIGALAASGWLLSRFSPGTLLLGAALLALPRWAVTGLAPGPGWMVAAQALHGVNFGVFWLAGVAINQRYAPVGLGTTVQATFHAAMFGAGTLTAMGFGAVWLRFGDTRGLFLAASVFSVLAAAVLTRVLPEVAREAA
jgi:PPP family 3-phenylpropionic acid transporter